MVLRSSVASAISFAVVLVGASLALLRNGQPVAEFDEEGFHQHNPEGGVDELWVLLLGPVPLFRRRKEDRDETFGTRLDEYIQRRVLPKAVQRVLVPNGQLT